MGDGTISVRIRPTDPDFPYELPNGLCIAFNVPEIYPSVPISRVRVLHEEIPEALKEQLIEAVLKQARSEPRITLLKLTNWIDRNMEQLLTPLPEVKNTVEEGTKVVGRNSTITFVNKNRLKAPMDTATTDLEKDMNSLAVTFDVSEDVIGEESDESREVMAQAEVQASASDSRPTGTEIRITSCDMICLSLVRCTNLSLLCHCVRCKTIVEVQQLEPGFWRSIDCSKCNQRMSVHFRETPFHLRSLVVGYLDVESINPIDLLPSRFEATCSECLFEEGELPIFDRVHVGQPARTRCRQCHQDITFCMNAVRFRRLAPSRRIPSSQSDQMRRRPKKVAEPGVVMGQPLRDQGTCAHYKKSFRWLRFPCCGRAFPCDICHDEAVQNSHEMKLANQMICGFCSREQPCQDSCSACKKDLTKSSSKSNFWEGGTGTRDRRRMNRRDPHKFKGIHKTISRRQREKM